MSDEEVEGEATFEFDPSFQQKIVSLLLRDTKFALRIKDLIKPEFFTEDAMASVVAITLDHIKTYKSSPEVRILPTLLKDAIAAKRIRQDLITDVKKVVATAIKSDLSGAGYVADKIVEFAQHQAYERAIMTSVDLLDKGEFEKIKKVFAEAQAVGAPEESEEYDYFEEIESRTQRREDFNAGKLVKTGIPTGYKTINENLFHGGWGRRELSLLMAPAKGGKSLGLGDFTKNAALAGYNAYYGSCEVAAWIIAERLDAAISDTAIRMLNGDPQAVKAAIELAGQKSAKLKMRDYPSGTLKPSQLHRTLDSYRSDGIIFDLITIDYADIMAAEYRSDNQIDNLRSIYIDLRAIAYEFNAALLTATQTNRAGASKMTATGTDVAEDFNKARTADIIISINATEEEKKQGLARLFWALSRNTADGFTISIRQDREKMKFLTEVLGKS